ncbi:hypothetical protein F5B22DRAFT_35821 [Xylaria bambusicola]|uniref:uncharacterized protein n=1 Tax=Xylaria bambusicola TaxID=326684 RepID=UPI002007BC49|nr:uncharacterized protein F5B22DRAFT_35821 [Xylaria bambusicola]KAI0521048.1 hypothetical protein F5B22DRAFT_35821 [Xylaria bambusicola]
MKWSKNFYLLAILCISTEQTPPFSAEFYYLDSLTQVPTSKLIITKRLLLLCIIHREFYIGDNHDSPILLTASQRTATFPLVVKNNESFAV